MNITLEQIKTILRNTRELDAIVGDVDTLMTTHNEEYADECFHNIYTILNDILSDEECTIDNL